MESFPKHADIPFSMTQTKEKWRVDPNFECHGLSLIQTHFLNLTHCILAYSIVFTTISLPFYVLIIDNYADLEVYPMSLRLFVTRTSKILLRLNVLDLMFPASTSYYVLFMFLFPMKHYLLTEKTTPGVNSLMLTPQNGQTRFKNLAANATRFLECV